MIGRIKTWLAIAGSVIVALAGAILWGWKRRGDQEKVKDLEADIETRKRVHEADDFTDADDARDWLRNRKP